MLAAVMMLSITLLGMVAPSVIVSEATNNGGIYGGNQIFQRFIY